MPVNYGFVSLQEGSEIPAGGITLGELFGTNPNEQVEDPFADMDALTALELIADLSRADQVNEEVLIFRVRIAFMLYFSFQDCTRRSR